MEGMVLLAYSLTGDRNETGSDMCKAGSRLDGVLKIFLAPNDLIS